MTLNQRVNWIVGLLSLTVSVILVTGFVVSSRLAQAQADNRIATDALRNHLEAGIAFSEMKSDIYQAVTYTSGHNRQTLGAIATQSQENMAWFQRAMSANGSMDLPESIRSQLATVKRPQALFVADCERLLARAQSGVAITEFDLKRLDRESAALRKHLKTTSDVIVGTVETNQRHVAILTVAWRTILLLGGLAMLAIAGFIASVLRRRMVKPIARLTSCLQALTAGRMDVELSDRNSPDEIGELAKGLEAFREAVLEARKAEDRARAAELARQQEVAERLDQDARRDAEQRERRKAELTAMASHLEERALATADLIARASNAMHMTTTALATGAVQTRDAARTANQASDRSAQDAQVVVTATTQMMAAIEEVSQLTATSANSARIMAEQSMHVGQKVAGLEAAAEQIGAVSKLIADIAAKTNMLALNATIEAARAGVQGQGFAVVAGEVKSLAEQIAEATREIGGQIDGVRSTVGDVSTAISDIGRSIVTFDQSSTAIATAIDEQGAAIADINRTIQGSVGTAEELRTSMSTLLSQAETTGAGAADIVGAVKDLERQGSELSGQIRNFIDQIRAA